MLRLGLTRDEVDGLFIVIDAILTLDPAPEEKFERITSHLEEDMELELFKSNRFIDKGLEKGRREAVFDNLEARFGRVPESVQTELNKITDLNRLRKLGRLAATIESIEGFQSRL